MAGADTNLAASALAVALVAFVVALGQLLQQYLATADGYRRCQSSVMGDWAKKTRLRWRWSEFRFETLFTTPSISLTFMSSDGSTLLLGDDAARELSFLPPVAVWENSISQAVTAGHSTSNENPKFPRGNRNNPELSSTVQNATDELVCWLPLLHWLHETTKAVVELSSRSRVATHPGHDVVKSTKGLEHLTPNALLPALQFRERSWDFQPPDVIRPLAKTTLSDIAILARRMGMRWKDFSPESGSMRAEGNSHVMSTTTVRSLGIVLQYNYMGHNSRQKPNQILINGNFERPGNDGTRFVPYGFVANKTEVYIPTQDADRCGFGIIKGMFRLMSPTYTVGTQEQIIKTLRILEPSGSSSAALKNILKEFSDYSFRIADIIAMSSVMIRQSDSPLVQVPAPSENTTGFTVTAVGRRAFKTGLELYLTDKPNLVEKVGHILEDWQVLSQLDNSWDFVDETNEEQEEAWVVTRNPKYLNRLHVHTYDLGPHSTLSERRRWRRFKLLLAAHIRHAIFAPEGETTPARVENPDYFADVQGYFENLPKIVESVLPKIDFAPMKSEDIEALWVEMLFRGCCWGACHFLVPGERVPATFYGSQLPVYIG